MRTILLMIIVAVFSLNISAQESPEVENNVQNTEGGEEHFPTGRELIAHRRITKIFNNKLRQTHDLAEALKGISVNDWCSRTVSEVFKSEENLFDPITNEELINSDIYSRFYISFGNYMYISRVHHMLLPDGHEKEDCIPYRVKQSGQGNPLMAMLIDDATLKEELEPTYSLSKLNDWINSSNDVVNIYKEHLFQKINENRELYAEKLIKIEREYRYKGPSIEVLSEERFGLPVGTRIMTSRGSLSHLVIAETNGTFKVFALMIEFGD